MRFKKKDPFDGSFDPWQGSLMPKMSGYVGECRGN